MYTSGILSFLLTQSLVSRLSFSYFPPKDKLVWPLSFLLGFRGTDTESPSKDNRDSGGRRVGCFASTFSILTDQFVHHGDGMKVDSSEFIFFRPLFFLKKKEVIYLSS